MVKAEPGIQQREVKMSRWWVKSKTVKNLGENGTPTIRPNVIIVLQNYVVPLPHYVNPLQNYVIPLQNYVIALQNYVSFLQNYVVPLQNYAKPFQTVEILDQDRHCDPHDLPKKSWVSTALLSLNYCDQQRKVLKPFGFVGGPAMGGRTVIWCRKRR